MHIYNTHTATHFSVRVSSDMSTIVLPAKSNYLKPHISFCPHQHTQAGSSSIFAAGRVLNSNTSKNLVLGAPAALDTGAHLEPSLLLSLGMCGGRCE
jgi:hypothetical protein